MTSSPSQPLYEIRVLGHLSSHHKGSLAPLALETADDGTTALRGIVVDQPALHGVFRVIEQLGLTLLSVRCLNERRLLPQKGTSEGSP